MNFRIFNFSISIMIDLSIFVSTFSLSFLRNRWFSCVTILSKYSARVLFFYLRKSTVQGKNFLCFECLLMSKFRNWNWNWCKARDQDLKRHYATPRMTWRLFTLLRHLHGNHEKAHAWSYHARMQACNTYGTIRSPASFHLINWNK